MYIRFHFPAKFVTSYFRPRDVGIRVLNVLRKYERIMLEHCEDIVETWNHPVHFDAARGYADASPWFEITTNDEIFNDLNEGTTVRYDVMTRDFEPKTSVRRLWSTYGQGGFAYRDEQNPRPGIEAREWDYEMLDRYYEDFFTEISQAIAKGLNL